MLKYKLLPIKSCFDLVTYIYTFIKVHYKGVPGHAPRLGYLSRCMYFELDNKPQFVFFILLKDNVVSYMCLVHCILLVIVFSTIYLFITVADFRHN